MFSLQTAHLTSQTHNKYVSAGLHFRAFCEAHEIPEVPVHIDTVLHYATDWVFSLNYSAQTLMSRFTGIRWYLERKYGTLPDRRRFYDSAANPADGKRVAQLLEALARIQGRVIKKSRPILTHQIQSLVTRNTSAGSPLWRLQAIAYVCFLRCLVARPSEVLGKPMSCIQESPLRNHMLIWHHGWGSKTFKKSAAPFGVVTFRANPDGFTVIMDYLKLLQPPSPESFVFPLIHPLDNAIQWNTPATRTGLVARVQLLLKDAGVANADRYTGNMGRRGGVSELINTVPGHFLNRQGKWSAGSSTKAIYDDQTVMSSYASGVG